MADSKETKAGLGRAVHNNVKIYTVAQTEPCAPISCIQRHGPPLGAFKHYTPTMRSLYPKRGDVITSSRFREPFRTKTDGDGEAQVSRDLLQQDRDNLLRDIERILEAITSAENLPLAGKVSHGGHASPCSMVSAGQFSRPRGHVNFRWRISIGPEQA